MNTEEFRKDVGNKLKEIREASGKKTEELAEVVGVTSAMMYKNEQGVSRMSFEDMCLIADFYGVSVDYFNPLDSKTKNLTDEVNRLSGQVEEIKRILD